MQGSARSGSTSPGHAVIHGGGHVHALPLHYGESDDPCKMTYSIMAFFGRPCVLPKHQQNCRHTGALAGSRRACTGSSSSAGAALVRSLSVAPFLDDGLEEDGGTHKKAASWAVAEAQGPAGGFESLCHCSGCSKLYQPPTVMLSQRK